MSVLDTLSGWARRASSWADLQADSRAPRDSEPDAGGQMIYRLRHWPTLPSAVRTADVLRLLSLMSSRPVSRQWMLTHTRLSRARVDDLLDRLVAQGALEEINPASFPPEPRAGAR